MQALQRAIFYSPLFLVFLIAALFPSAVFAVQYPDTYFSSERQIEKPSSQIQPDSIDGSLRYEFPLTLPPGRNGMAPSLSLQYSSQGGEHISPFGFGWSISIPYIERINKRGLNKIFDQDDFFSTLDGELKATSTTEGMGGSPDGAFLGELFDSALLTLADADFNAVDSAETSTSSTTTSTSTATTGPVTQMLQGKTPEEQATIKGEEIAKLWSIPKTLVGNYYIEIVFMNAIPGGVEVFVKAWDKNDRKIGFGKDGTIEIERIRVMNPYIEVPDSVATTTQYDSLTKKFEEVPTPKEDLKAAILLNIGHTVSVMKYKFPGSTKIVQGTIGQTVTTLQPDSTDGKDTYMGEFYGPPWTDVSDDGTNVGMYAGDASSGSNAHYRPLLKFSGISSIPAGAAVQAVTLTLHEHNDQTTAALNFRRALRDWSATQATWTNYSTGNAWTTAGAGSNGNDRVSATSTSYTSNSTASGAINLSNTGLVNDVQGWVDGTSSNYGWLISAETAEETGTSPATGIGWRTSNHTTASERPKLVIEHAVTSVTCGSPASDVGYGALVENGDFRSYQYWDDCYWKMTDKSGTIYSFGTTSAARIYNAANASSTARWLLEEVRDRNDNYISYSYFKDNSQAYPYKIKYTGSGSTDGIYEVEFIRESRTDTATSSSMGFPVHSRYRISEVQVKVNGIVQRSYALGYGTGTNGVKSMLTSITESGVDDSGATTTLPAVTFGYTTKDADWTYSSSWVMPAYFTGYNAPYENVDWGSRLDDFNGDGWTDIAWYRDHVDSGKLYLNNGDGTWSTTTPTGLGNFVSSIGADQGARTGDVDGDGLADFWGNGTSTNVAINTNRGGSFATSSAWLQPVANINTTGGNNWDQGTRIVDINGDGLPDFLKSYEPDTWSAENGIYLNNGNGWDGATSTVWALPSSVYFAGATTTNGIDHGVRFADFNGDSLVDMIQSRAGNSPATVIYINDGDGTWSSIIPTGFTFTIVTSTGEDNGIRVADVNADGLADIIDTPDTTNPVYLNQGGGKSFTASWSDIVPQVVYSGAEYGVRFVDIDADGIVDMARSYDGPGSPAGQNGAYLGNGVIPDLLTRISTNAGATTTISYKPSTQYTSGSTELNRLLPMVIQTVETITADNGFGTVGTTTYSYTGGEYYYANEFDRKFAGYATTTVTDAAGNVTKTYAHQGNGTQSTIGEYSDSKAKIGKTYRTEVYDANNNLFSKQIDKWDSATLSNSRDFVKRVRSTEFSYDGDSDHRDKATTFTYNDTNGNVSEKAETGEVTGSDDGSYTDTGSDTRTTSYSYATSTTYQIYGLPMTETVKNNSGTQVAARNFYYDSLSAGSVEKGNLTKEERWISGSTYASTTRAYNSYGLVTSETDPRANTTTFSYESKNMYVGTTTNPLGHITETYRDYSSGKVKKLVDPNSRSFESVFDGLDRVTSEKIPDHLGTPSNTITKTTYTYIDTPKVRRVLHTDNLNSATSTESYTYFDGFLRPIQERREAEASNTYVVKDTKYDARGSLAQESLPYENTGAARSTMTSNSNLLVTSGYDPLKRATSTINVLGTESYAYDQWIKTVTDRRGKTKDYTSDAFGNLVQVDEDNATTTYITTYTYDALNNLTRITDAASNIRNFVYDGLSRLTSAEDLHASGDATYGTRTYTYDLANNIATSTDAKSQSRAFTYDAINRVLTEDYTDGSGTEISYGYDSCTNGKGRLCAATTTDAVTNLAYDALGNVSSESRTIDGSTYTTTYTRDRLNNITALVYPNSREARYGYNSAGQLEEILTKPSGGTYSTVISDFDYAPTGQVSYKRFGNDVETTLTYDSTKLYRLSNIATNIVGMGGDMEGAFLPELPLDPTPVVDMPVPEPLPADTNAINQESDTSSPPTESPPLKPPVVEPSITEVPAIPIEQDISTEESRTATTTEAQLAPEILIEPSVETTTSTSTATSTIDLIIPDVATSTATSTIDLHIPGLAIATSTATSSIEALPIPDNLPFAVDSSLAGEFIDTGSGLRIEIQNVEPIEGGIEVLARAWKNDIPIGFGHDGSVEVERFRFFGISPLVEDPTGPYEQVYTVKVRTEENPTGSDEVIRTKYSEDPLKALQIQLADTVRIAANGSNPIPGKIGHTTSTFYPDASPESTTVDGFTARDTGGVSWSSLRTGSAQAANDTAALSSDGTLIQFASGSNWHYLGRATFLFNTAAIGSDTVSSATFSVVAASKTDNATLDAKFNLTAMTPASDTALVTGDYLNYGDTTFATEIDLGDINTDGSTYNNWTLNSSGLAAISANGITKLGVRLSADISNTQPSFPSSSQFSAMGIYYADQAGTTKDPKLVVIHSAPAPAPGSIQDISYTYDAVGNITQIADQSTSSVKTIVFGYDDLNRLTSASTTVASSTPFSQTYAYSSLGNITNKSDVGDYAYAGTGYANPHAATAVNGVAYSYDNNGNRTDYGAWDYTWDYRDRLTQTATGTATTTYAYDDNNKRVWQKVAGSATTTYANQYYSAIASATTTAYIYAGDVLIATIDNSASGTTTTRYIHPDHLNSTHIVTNENAAIVQALDYYPYGQTRIDSNSDNTDQKRQFIGQFFDDSSNLSYLNARYYEVARGQFLTQDPVFLEIGGPLRGKELGVFLANPQSLNSGRTMGGSNSGFASGWSGNTQSRGSSISQIEYLADPQMQNSYAYARGNPIRYKDPQGLWYGEVSLEFSPPPPFFFSASYGIRFDGTGIVSFISGGPSIGAAFPLKGIFSSGNLSHQSEWTVSRVAELFGGAGMGVSTEGVFDPRRPLSTGKNPVTSYHTGAGLGGGVSQQYTFSTPIYTWGGSSSNSNRPSGNLDAKSLGIGNTGGGTFTGTYNFGAGVGTYNFGTGSWAK